MVVPGATFQASGPEDGRLPPPAFRCGGGWSRFQSRGESTEGSMPPPATALLTPVAQGPYRHARCQGRFSPTPAQSGSLAPMGRVGLPSPTRPGLQVIYPASRVPGSAGSGQKLQRCSHSSPQVCALPSSRGRSSTSARSALRLAERTRLTHPIPVERRSSRQSSSGSSSIRDLRRGSARRAPTPSSASTVRLATRSVGGEPVFD